MKKLKILMFDMILHFKFIYDPKNLQVYKCDSPNNPPNCFFSSNKRFKKKSIKLLVYICKNMTINQFHINGFYNLI
jgi:hypothetical protein